MSRKLWRVQGISNVSFQVKQRRVFSIVGPNGAGKTTLVNVVTACCGRPPVRSAFWAATSPAGPVELGKIGNVGAPSSWSTSFRR